MKRTLLFVILLTVTSYGYSQFNVGFKIGGNLAKIKYDNISDNQVFNPCGQLGLPFNIQVTPLDGAVQFSIQPELLIMQKGNKNKSGDNFNAFTYTYISQPIMLKTRFGKGDVRPYFNIGPYFDIMFLQYNIFRVADQRDGDIDTPNTDYQKLFDFGLNVGVGANFKDFTLEVRYTRGFTDVYTITKSKNMVLSVSLGYLFLE